jgi:hypothetical protein
MPATIDRLTWVPGSRDDLTVAVVSEMKQSGFQPAVVTETSPGNFQVWLKHAEMVPKDLVTAAARALGRFQGDRGAADWRFR